MSPAIYAANTAACVGCHGQNFGKGRSLGKSKDWFKDLGLKG